jgi:hypothetical protein
MCGDDVVRNGSGDEEEVDDDTVLGSFMSELAVMILVPLSRRLLA